MFIWKYSYFIVDHYHQKISTEIWHFLIDGYRPAIEKIGNLAENTPQQ